MVPHTTRTSGWFDRSVSQHWPSMSFKIVGCILFFVYTKVNAMSFYIAFTFPMKIVGCSPLSINPTLNPPAPAHTSANVKTLCIVLYGDHFFPDLNAFGPECICCRRCAVFHNVFFYFARLL